MKPKKMIETMKKKLTHVREQNNFEDDFVPNSISYTKLELPIYYSNLIYIEDMQIENSTYFITANGFISKKIYLSSSKHDKTFNMSNCVFRIYPKTYNVNKDKVKDYIDSQTKSLGDELQELHFKFSAEMFNNLDIIQNKFGEPVRYGDIIMLLHENSRMFIEFNASSKTIRLSNHDSDATLFLIEPAKEIMLNDNQILKTGQPIKLRIASFSYSEKSLYLGLRFPYMNNNILQQSVEKSAQYGRRTTFRQKAFEEIQILNDDDENVENTFLHHEEKVYDEKIKKYIQEPEIIVEEATSMKWRCLLFTTFTTNENLLIYGDFVQLFHCNSNSVLGIKINENTVIEDQLNDLRIETINNNGVDPNTMKSTKTIENKDNDGDLDRGEDEIDNIFTLIDQSISQIENEDEIIPLNNLIKTTFKLDSYSMFSHKQDVDSTWVLSNIFPTIKHQSFIRYFEESNLDTYHMIFRIKNFKTNQILTIQQWNDVDHDALLGTVKGKQIEGLIDGCDSNNGKVYKFVLIDNINEGHKTAQDTEILSEDYQYSLFGFKKSMKALSYYSSRPEKNDFVYLYHIATKSYLSIMPSGKNLCNLTLVKYPDECEVFKVFTVSPKSQWEYRFLKNLFNLLNFVINKIQKIKELTDSALTKTMTKILTTTHFILDHLNKFTMNLFINKFVYDSGYNSVVNSRQSLILNFGFTKVFLRNFIYYYWMRNNMEEMRKLNDLLAIQSTKRNYTLTSDNELTFTMFTYTQSIFDFMIFYCKDNEEIKDELYANLDVFFYFFNLIESCLYGMIELFKNNEKILISLIRDCSQNPKFKSTLYTIGTTYFGNKHDDYDNYNLIDLIFDYIEISKYENDPRNNINKEHSLNSKAISLLSREQYFELLKALVNNKKGTNILENQREIINKIITKKRDNSDAYMFKEFIYSKGYNTDEGEFEANIEVPPCLKELLYSLSIQNPDDKIHFFIQTHEQFTIDKLFPNKNKRIDNQTLAANIKWIMYFFPSSGHLTSVIDPEEEKKTEQFSNQIKNFYYEVVNQLRFLSNTIDFSNRSQVNLINSFLCLLKIIFEKNTVIEFNSISISNVTGILLSFLTRKYQRIINDTQNISNLIHGEMNEKKIILKQRIIKSENSQYISIAESWLNVYLVFKFFLLKRLEDSSLDKEYSNKSKMSYNGSFDKIKFQVSENKNLLPQKEEDDNNIKTNGLFQGSGDNTGVKQQYKGDMSFYTKDELIHYYKGNKHATRMDENLKGTLQQEEPDFCQTKSRFLFSELHNSTRKSEQKRNFSEDDKIKNMYEVSKNIIDILKLTIKQNITVLNDNFYNYYNSLDYSPNKKFELIDFIEHCVPNLDSCVGKVNSIIKTFREGKLNSKFKRNEELTNLNSVFEDKEEKKDLCLNFIQNLINVFNLSEDIEMQESILDLIYVFFNQRKRFFNSVVMFNEHLSDFSNIKYNPFNNKDKIKTNFKKFYYAYEKTKQEYEVKTIDYFLTFLLSELINIFKKILKYWKNEFRILSLAYTNKYCQNMEANELMILKIEKVLEMLLEQKENISKPIFDTHCYLEYIEVFIQIVYFIRNNVENPLFNSLITILNEDGGMFNKMYFSLINDFISKGKELSEWYSKKKFMFFKVVRDETSGMQNYTSQEIQSFKNKYYSALFMLITLQTVSLPRNDKTFNYLHQILINEKELLKYDSFSAFLILLSISDLQKGSLSLDYFFIMEKVNELNKNRCEENSISPVLQEQLPNSFTHLYVDIMINVLKFIILKDTMINEINLDEIVVDNFIYLVKKIAFNDTTKSKLKLSFIKLVNYFHEIPSLYKIYKTKTRQDAIIQINSIPINLYFPTALELYPLFRKHFDQIKFYSKKNESSSILVSNNQLKKKDTKKRQIDYVKRTFCLYKYLLFYCLEVEPKYFECTELFDNQQIPYNWLKKLIVTSIAGREDIIINPNSDLNSSNIENEGINSELKYFYQSSFFYLLHCYSFNQIVKNKDYMDLQGSIFHIEDLYLSELDQMDFFSQKKYVRGDSSDRDIKNYTDEEKEIENNIFYSTGKDETVCLYVFNKLMRYDQNIDNANIYKKIYIHLNLKSKKVKMDKMYAFKSMLWKNADDLYGYADNETASIIYYLLILLDSETTMQYDEIFLTFINKITEYISVGFSKAITRKRVKLTCFLLYIIIEILKFYEENEAALIGHTFRKKTLREAQIMFLKTGIIEKSLSLVCKYNIPEVQSVLPYVFEMFCRLLKKGNYNSQEVFYNLFTTKSKFEPVFSFMLEVISKQINHILSNKLFIIRHRKKQLSFEKKLSLRESFKIKLDSKILHFLQLLCENHNKKLQMYLHYQNNFRKSYDLVSQTQNYLNIIANYFEQFLFESLTKCFDLLIEFVQGPCIENQIALINSKVLITLNEILQCYVSCEKDALDKEFPERNVLYDENEHINNDSEKKFYLTNLTKMTTQQISLLTFKSSILLHALIENRTKDDNIYFTIKSVVKEETVKSVYRKIFFEHLTLLVNSNDFDDYGVKLKRFNRAGDIEESAKTEKIKIGQLNREPVKVEDYLILETGFLLYFLFMHYEDFDANKEQMTKTNKRKTIISQISDTLSGGFFDLFVSLYLFCYYFSLSILQTITYIISGCIYAFSIGKLKIFNLMRRMFKHQMYNESHCIKFYEKYTESIEILRDDVVYRIYFYILPYCKQLNRFEKTRFLEEVDRTNSKTKLTEIIKFADKKRYELEFAYKIKEYSSYIPLFGVLFNSVDLWKDISLILNIVQNFFNIFAVYKVGRSIDVCLTPIDCIQITYWTDEKSFFNMNQEDFNQVIRIMSFIQCGLVCLIFVEYICSTMPAIYKSSKEEINRKNRSSGYRHLSIAGLFLKTTLINSELIYYSCYVIFAFLGTFNSDFFFAFLLLEIIQRFKTLRNVLKAIKNPYKQLFMTFCLWIIVIYFFAIFGYTFFKNDFPNDGDCSSLVRCVATIFYQNNKMDNGIGGYLDSIYSKKIKDGKWVGRFFYDELFNLLLKILVIQMISGIIIDNFALLRVQEMDMLSDMENLCTICGLKREDIEKIYDKYGKTYQDHISDHNVFNYIFYIIYLCQKDRTEFTGVESYVYELAYTQKDITWFPIDQ